LIERESKSHITARTAATTSTRSKLGRPPIGCEPESEFELGLLWEELVEAPLELEGEEQAVERLLMPQK